MKESEKTFYELHGFSKSDLKMPEDMRRIIDLSMKHNKMPVLERAAFTAKFLQGLFGIIQRGEAAIDDAILAKYMFEYQENIEKLKNDLGEIIREGSEFINRIFNEKYFALSQQCLDNLNDLCSDLAWYKMYLNDKKNAGKVK